MIYGEAQTVTTNSPTNLMYSVPSQCFSRLMKLGSFSTYHTRYWIFFQILCFIVWKSKWQLCLQITYLDQFLLWKTAIIVLCQTPYPSVLDFWKIKFEKSSLTNSIFNLKKSISKLIFAGYTGSENPVRNRLKIQFVKLDFSKLIFS